MTGAQFCRTGPRICQVTLRELFQERLQLAGAIHLPAARRGQVGQEVGIGGLFLQLGIVLESDEADLALAGHLLASRVLAAGTATNVMLPRDLLVELAAKLRRLM